jgi:tRNA(fMet)-specific endonuclease VapC
VAVLDTSIAIELLRRRPTARLRGSMDAIRRATDAGEPLSTTRFNAAELYTGAEAASDPPDEFERISAFLGGLRVLEFDDPAARVFGQIMDHLRRIGRPTGDMDALIASVALAHRESVITRNARHFADVPGLIVNAVP